MTETPPAVALLFDDTELGGHLRDVLQERGARIVHEGDVSGISRELLERVGADVLVVNLDDGADDALDRLYEVIDGDRPRVVFNDAQASRSLDGWDRARWARHLAVKVLAAGDVDPPRPEGSLEVQPPAAETVSPAPAPIGELQLDPPDAIEVAPVPETPPVEAEMAAAPAVGFEDAPDSLEALPPDAMSDIEFGETPDGDLLASEGEVQEPSLDGSSEDLAAELEALLASGELPGEEDEEGAGTGLRFAGDDEPPELFDGDFGGPDAAWTDAFERSRESADTVGAEAPEPVLQTDQLQASEPIDASLATEPATVPEPIPTAAPAAVSAPDGWALVDDETPAESTDKPDPASFGIEKVSAADFLAPDVEPVAPDVELTMSLELVSLEESVAPQAFVPDHEMLLDDLDSALSRVVLLGAGVDAVESVATFLTALPDSSRMTFVLIQHLGGRSGEAVLETLASRCALPMQLADAAHRAMPGEVLMVPAGQQIRLRRDGNVELLAQNEDGPNEPSIDATLSMAAHVFGRDALAIVFAGRGNDAVAGSQAIHDRGGQVWVESSSGEHFADMVSGIFAERLVSYSGTPTELAAHLIEVFP